MFMQFGSVALNVLIIPDKIRPVILKFSLTVFLASFVRIHQFVECRLYLLSDIKTVSARSYDLAD